MKRPIFGGRWRVLGVILVSLTITVALLEIYCRLPLEVTLTDIELPPAVPLTLVFHGSADADNPQFPRLVAALKSTGRSVHYVRWDPWSDIRLRAAASAERTGSLLAESVAEHLTEHGPGSRAHRLNEASPLFDLELVAHSSGAYVLDALCERLRGLVTSPVRIRMVFVDAFQIRGLLDWGHGAREHGRCADDAIAILNTDDPAPSTNRALERMENIDVTTHPRRSEYSGNGHYWALEYLIIEQDESAFPRLHASSQYRLSAGDKDQTTFTICCPPRVENTKPTLLGIPVEF